MNDELANDRTFLAWLRTGIACFGLGFVVAKAAFIINAGGKPVAHKDLYGVTGTLIVLAGVVLVVAGLVQHRQLQQRLRAEAGRSLERWPVVATCFATVAGLLLTALIAIST